jgi:hypothetical protein
VTQLHGAAVVGPRDRRRRRFAEVAGEERGVGEEVVRRRGKAGADVRPRERRREAHDELVEAERLPGEDLRELRAQRAGDALRKAMVAGGQPLRRRTADCADA